MAKQAAKERCLAASIGTDDANLVTGVNLHGDIAEDEVAAKTLGRVGYGNEWHGSEPLFSIADEVAKFLKLQNILGLLERRPLHVVMF